MCGLSLYTLNDMMRKKYSGLIRPSEQVLNGLREHSGGLLEI
jgi:hypothetical protein